MENSTPSSQLPSWLAKYANVGFDTDDVAALLSSIESSQNPQPSLAQLPAELLLHVLEYVPVDHVLDWRLVCRGFRDAIDTRILYHHLKRTRIVGFIGPPSEYPISLLPKDQYDRVKFVHAHFQQVEGEAGGTLTVRQNLGNRPPWYQTHAAFKIEDLWFRAFSEANGTDASKEEDIKHAEKVYRHAQSKLELRGSDTGFGTVTWCVVLDHAVLDLEVPLQSGRNTFQLSVDLHQKTVKVAWKEMLFSFLKTERALRHVLDQTGSSDFTYSHAEDCLRQVRRQRMHSILDLDNKVDRHLKWSLRLLCPLFAKRGHNETSTLQLTENQAINVLLFLRREASMTPRQIADLHQLNADLQEMEQEMDELDDNYDEFRTHMFPHQKYTCVMSRSPHIPYNPIAWPEELRATVKQRVSKWHSQRKVMRQISALLNSSNQALAVPEDSFDDVFSDL